MSPRLAINGQYPISQENVEDVHLETLILIEELIEAADARPKTDPFQSEKRCGPAEESFWDMLSPPPKYKLDKMHKADLVTWVEKASKMLIERLYPVMRVQLPVSRRCSEIEKKYMERQEDLISAQKALVGAQEQLLKLQEQLLEKREDVIVDVQIAAKEEISSFSSVLKRECETALAPSRIQKAVSAASEARSCNIIIHGLTDSPGDSEELLEELWTTLEVKPLVKNAQRLGRFSADQTRPLKLTLRNKEAQSGILNKKSRLRQSDSFSRVYISPDLTAEERVARGILVKKLKEEKERSPGKQFRIKAGKVVEVSSETQ